MLSRGNGGRKAIFAVAAAAIAVAIACSDTTLVAPRRSLQPAPTLINMSSCGASFRMISSETDSLMAAYGIANTVDTVDVCEAWTGSDYAYQATAIGSSDNVPGFVDTVQTVTYQDGAVAGYTFSNDDAAPATSVGSTSFDVMYADDATRSASYDYPYYGVSSPDPSTCIQQPCELQSRSPNASATAAVSDRATAPAKASLATDATSRNASSMAVPPFAKHGLHRRGVRALVDGADEISRSREGYRRFRMVQRGLTLVLSIDPKTELLVAEESDGPADTAVTTHKWAQVAGGYVRDHSDVETVEWIGGRRIRSRTSVLFQKVRIGDPGFAALRGIDGSP
jgi:hypothetical protein